jgi:hypothetical protein
MEFSRLPGWGAPPSFLLVWDLVGTTSFNDAFFCFRFAACESTGTSSVRADSELDEESEEESLFRFNREVGGVDRELTDDISTLAPADEGTTSNYHARSVSARGNLIYGSMNVSKILHRCWGGGELLYFPWFSFLGLCIEELTPWVVDRGMLCSIQALRVRDDSGSNENPYRQALSPHPRLDNLLRGRLVSGDGS